MTTEPLEHFRTFITESFTAVAVNIFSEVQNLVQCYEDENKRLQSLLKSVLQPQVHLCRIDVGSSYPALRECAPGAQSRAVFSDTGLMELKEEQTECVISDDVMDQVKTEPETICILNSHSTLELSDTPCSSAAVSASTSVIEDDNIENGEGEGGNGEDEEEEEIEEEVNENREDQEPSTSQETEPSPQKTLLECPRFKKPDNTFLPTPSEYKAFISRQTELYKDMPAEQRPLITLMGLDEDVEFVECALGEVPKGCPLSYHHPLPSKKDFKPLDNTPPQPRLPLQSHTVPSSTIPPLLENQLGIINSMALTWEAAYTLEQSTRQDKAVTSSVKNGRLFDCFKDLFSIKDAEGSAEKLVAKLKRGKRRCKQATIEKELRMEAVREYCQLICVNWYPCGVVVHPGAPWIAAHPHGLVYDPNEEISFGILHVKCEHLRSFTESTYMVCKEGTPRLNPWTPTYWHIQGELMVTGTAWCDLLLFCGEDMLIQRVYRDEALINTLKHKMDAFFFKHYLPNLYQNLDQD
ncbi:uncharacterized protein LOC129407264 isoform X2 [Boleophthalmus pectinirostris]|uniref:uncharacterized protein LOC129407264 isoform X2 n=1 Tax=Boleophthalmus pectinirostris TaxID=150288 RepID=UPI00242E0F99|nr:uncharacterized protein LOC129407264 isoform X2 [Boleophthalmus pectinirostris]